MSQLSGPQIPGFIGVTTVGNKIALQKTLLASYATYRAIRTHPTVALARGLSAAPVIATEWSVEANDDTPDEIVEFLKGLFDNPVDLKSRIAFAGIDYGWFGAEQVYEVINGLIYTTPKQLMPDLNLVLIDENGNFSGFYQLLDSGVEIPANKSLLISFRTEGDNLYGQSLLENIRTAYTAHVNCETKAAQYDGKVAGAQPKIGYPPGKYEDPDTGQIKDMYDLAAQVLAALSDGEGIIYPQQLIQNVPGIKDQQGVGWAIETFEDKNARQASFVDRLNYLDKMLVRGLILPERSILEGSYGTKAEAEAHADMALLYSEYISRSIVEAINEQVVGNILALNFGEENRYAAKFVASPLVDTKLSYLREVYAAVLKDPSSITRIDLDSIMEELGVPASDVVTQPTDMVQPNTDPSMASQPMMDQSTTDQSTQMGEQR